MTVCSEAKDKITQITKHDCNDFEFHFETRSKETLCITIFTFDLAHVLIEAQAIFSEYLLCKLPALYSMFMIVK